ncbi:MAG: calcium/proton exchanger [Acidobacteria bacterium]|nr:MAG: calcium/proton exchanger [Acidobacteriota bacterium]
MEKREKIILGLAAMFTAASGVLHFAGANPVVSFVVTAGALALLAVMVGDATEQLGSRLGPGATGVLQSALGNLPELFVCIFALRAGLDHVVQAALIGSILGNSVLVLGLALLLGGLKNGTQRFNSEPPKMIVALMLLASAVLVVPTLAKELHTPAESHILSLDIFLAIILIILLAANIYFSVKGDPSVVLHDEESSHAEWQMGLTVAVLTGTAVGAAFVSDWFVEALQPAMATLGISETFAGLVVVAVAGNAIENLVGVQLAWKNQADYAVSVILNSSLQIALGLFPILVLLSYILGGAILTFVLTPMLVAVLLLAVIVSAFIIYDGESIWLEGLALIGLYCIIASAFWWG